MGYASDLLDQLRGRELLRVADKLSGETNLEFSEARQDERIEAVFRWSVANVDVGMH